MLPEEATFENLPGFQVRFLGKLTQRIQSLSAAELKRLSRKDEQDQMLYRSALAGLANIIESRPEFAPQDQDLLLAAMQAVGAATRVMIVPPSKSDSAASLRFQVDSICRASRVRSRIVALKGDWWRRDCGAMLGFLASGKKPADDGVRKALRWLSCRYGRASTSCSILRTVPAAASTKAQSELSSFG